MALTVTVLVDPPVLHPEYPKLAREIRGLLNQAIRRLESGAVDCSAPQLEPVPH